MRVIVLQINNLNIVAKFIGISPGHMIFAKTAIQSITSAAQFLFYAAVGSLKVKKPSTPSSLNPCAYKLRQRGYIEKEIWQGAHLWKAASIGLRGAQSLQVDSSEQERAKS
ncbi:hypothetical protein CBS147355_9694 [Penicillium roqueforti]|nr:hypothetical protein CBS147355_9694 [Penicillium roqueforti]KAI3244485.1 hypothetical protein CBS147309_9598 [Penicillium roqueforti]